METLAEKLVNALRQKGMKISFAESCTGGLVSAAVTSVPGSSDVYDGGICSYSNGVKNHLIGVDSSVLESVGPVSAECAFQMAEGVRALFAADIGVSVTGFAGPGGGTPDKPVGTVFIACVTERGRIIKHCRFTGNRRLIRRKTVKIAMETAISALEGRLYV